MDRTSDTSTRTVCTASAPAVHRLFAHLPRADQRRWAEVYVKGLLTTPGKKSVRRMAASVTPSPTASQSLQQFVNVSPWEWRPVRAELTRWVAAHTPVHAWTVAPVVIPKRGSLAAGVHRRFVPALGRTVNCQLALGAFLTTGLGDVSVDWRLYLPHPWVGDSRLREQARIPDTTGYTDTAGLCLDLLDRLARTTRRAPVVIDPEGHLDAEPLVAGLEERGHDWIVAVPDTLRLALAPEHGPAPRPPLETVRTLVRRHASPRSRAMDDAAGPRLGALSTVVPLPGGDRTCQLVGEWTTSSTRPDRTWLTNLSADRHSQAAALITSRAAARAGAAETELGLHDFAGRSYAGWHRHATLVSAASAQRRLCHDAGPRTHPAP
ncbi:transposase [Streptomyces antnestii]|uniref:Transposase n=1 Tax=Streptomyces antnestii TaxID=2494256 RepID=A0A437PYS8_9ACTN|nr:transposase [Streptomyces sp. San01]RVU27380.1 transposase [Streptomyces sp. San01]